MLNWKTESLSLILPYLMSLVHGSRSYTLLKERFDPPYAFALGSYADRPQQTAKMVQDAKMGPIAKEAADDESDELFNDAPHDPIRWFGVLAPPALKGAQRNFFAVVLDCVVALANTQTNMRITEAEVRRLRNAKKVVELVKMSTMG